MNSAVPRPAAISASSSRASAEAGRALIRGYHKPIMIAGGLGNVRRSHVEKHDVVVGAPLVVLGGPSMLIGLGGGAASSVGSGAELVRSGLCVRAARQPRDAAPRARSDRSLLGARRARIPILLIHDVGAGGLSNALPEAIAHSRSRRAHRSAQDSERRVGTVAHGDLVQRGAGALRAGARPRAASRSSPPCASASAARLPWWAKITGDGLLNVIGSAVRTPDAGRLCRSRCCWARRRA